MTLDFRLSTTISGPDDGFEIENTVATLSAGYRKAIFSFHCTDPAVLERLSDMFEAAADRLRKQQGAA